MDLNGLKRTSMDLNELKEDLEGLKEDHKWTKDVQRRP